MNASALVRDDPAYRKLFTMQGEMQRHGVELSDDIYSGLAALRAQGAVHAGGLYGAIPNVHPHSIFLREYPVRFATLDFETTNKAFNDNVTFSSRLYHDIFGSNALGETILHMGGAKHRKRRGTVQPLFTVLRARDWWQPRLIDGIVDSLICDFERDGSADLNQQLCARLPIHTITQGLGLTSEEAIVFRQNLMLTLTHHASEAERAAGAGVVRDILMRGIEARRSEPRDDVLSQMIHASFEDEDGEVCTLSDEDILSFCRVIMTAGGGTTWRQLGITLYALLNDRENWERVKADRKLVEPAITESLRWNPTAPLFFRVAEADTELGGTFIPQGAVIELCVGAANRDPARWDDPDRYSLDRKPQRHLAFGSGAHSCLGMFVAQAEMRVAINALADRLPRLRLDPDAPAPTVTGDLEMRGVSHLQVRFD